MNQPSPSPDDQRALYADQLRAERFKDNRASADLDRAMRAAIECGTSIARIATARGVTRRSIYLHYPEEVAAAEHLRSRRPRAYPARVYRASLLRIQRARERRDAARAATRELVAQCAAAGVTALELAEITGFSRPHIYSILKDSGVAPATLADRDK